jgi:hypothetical protein
MPRKLFQKVLVVGLESITSMRIPVKDSFSKLVEGKPQAQISNIMDITPIWLAFPAVCFVTL